jgi:phage shock protein PspC (stress-responsive transcriptional regulator)
MDENSSGSGPAGGFDRGRLKNVESWRRSRSDRMVAGVCGGIGRALDVDPVLIRVVMAVFILAGPGVLFYIAAWLLMPDEGSDRSPAQALLGDRVRPDHPWLWPVVIGGCVFLAIAAMSSFNFGRVVPGPLIVLGLIWFVVVRRKHGQGTGRPGGSYPTTPESTTTPYAAGDPAAPTDPSYREASAYPGGPEQPASEAGTTAPVQPAAYPTGATVPGTQRPQDRPAQPVQPVFTEDDPLGLYADEPVTQPPVAPPARGYRGVKAVVVILTGLAIAVAWLAGAPAPLALAIGLGALGLGMVLGGFVGRTLGLLPLGLLLALGLFVTSVFDSVPRDFGDIQVTAARTETITAGYPTHQLDAGSVRLDLSQAKFAPDAKVAVNVTVGEIVITLPPSVTVTGAASAKGGEVSTFGQRKSGHDVAVPLSDPGGDPKATAGQSVMLDLHVKYGSIRVERG